MRDRLEHPERMLKSYRSAIETNTRRWESVEGTFPERVMLFIQKAMDEMPAQRCSNDELSRLAVTLYYPMLDEVIDSCPEEHSFSALSTMENFAILTRMLFDLNEQLYHTTNAPLPPMEVIQQEMLTVIIARFSTRMYEKYGSQIYVVSDSLEWALLNTKLKNYPSEQLRLPFPAIYVALPERFRVYHWKTGWHEAEGAYVVEDEVTAYRSWRIMMVGKSKDKKVLDDDAIFHFVVELPKGMTVDESLDYTFSKFSSTQPNVVEEITVGGVKRKLVRGHPSPDHFEEYSKLLASMKPVFEYIMNIVIYTTLPDADARLYNASKEYRQLRDRANKAQGEKRRKLFEKLKGLHPRLRRLLGRDLVIDRSKEAGSDASEISGRKLTTRFLVTGHWHHYWTGEGRTTSITKWIQPYWKGPQQAPLTPERRRKIK